jgi:hypothetical protein
MTTSVASLGTASRGVREGCERVLPVLDRAREAGYTRTLPGATSEARQMADGKGAQDAHRAEERSASWEIDPESWARALERAEAAEEQAAATFPGGKPFPIPDTPYDLVDDEADVAPAYYAVNDRPVKWVRTPDGGLDVLAMNMRTGEFERDMSYLSRCFLPEGDVDKFPDEAHFEAYVESVRRNLPRTGEPEPGGTR